MNEARIAVSDQAIPFKKPSQSPSESAGRIGLVSLLSIALSLVAVIALKKVLQRKGVISDTPGARISVEDTKRLTPKLTVFLVKVDDIDYVLAQSGDELQLVKHQADEVKEHINES